MRFQHGVDESPTRLPISATEREASSCRTDRIFRSMASIAAKALLARSRFSHFGSIEIDFLFWKCILRICRIIFYFKAQGAPSPDAVGRAVRATGPSMRAPFTLLSVAVRLIVAVAALALAAGAPARAAGATPLVSVDWLAAHRGDADVVVLDIRSAID